MMRKINVAFANESLKEAFRELEKGDFQDKHLFSFLNRAIDDLFKNPSCGTKIAKRLWPKEYIKQGITNLWKYNLPDSWRLVYTIKQDEIYIVSVLLEWFDHKGYERRFHYLI